MSDDFVVHRNDSTGLQVEWHGVLLTLQPNQYHGLSGSVAVRGKKETQLLTFHGQSPSARFPLELHEDKL